MSLTELPSHEQEFERTPPHDMAAEQCVLGGMLLSQDAIADVIESLRTSDFYRPAHQIIYDAILDLYGRGEPADAITVAAALTTRGEIARVGGAPYLHTLMSSVPTAANAGYYARIVRERAMLRKLVEVGTRIAQRGYQADGSDADAILDWAEAEVLSIAEKRTGEDYSALSDIMPGALDEIEAIGSRGGQMTGVPTGFSDLDALTNGMHAGQLIIIAARPAIGKALALDTPLPTPTGWTTMGEVAVGDDLLAADGKPTRVVAATEIMHGRPCYRVEFSDGEVIVADADHQWLTWTRAARRYDAHRRGLTNSHADPVRPSVVTTEQLAEQLAATLQGGPTADQRPDHAVEMPAPLHLPAADLPIAPYALGIWLVDENSRIASADPEIVLHLEASGVQDVGQETQRAGLEAIGALDDKHIPMDYLRASQRQRRELLAGMLDTIGTVTDAGAIQLTVTSRRLACDARELILSLGYQCSMRTKQARGHGADSQVRVHGADAAVCYTVDFTTHDEVFRLSRKQLAHKRRLRHDPQRTRWRYITDVQPIESRPVRCVQVDNRDHLYLAGRGLVPTHNSTLALDFARAASIKHGLTSAFFSLEMGRNEITMRLLSAEARVALHAMRSGTMQDEDWARLARRMSEVAEAPLFIDDSPNMSMMEIRAKCRRLKLQHDLRLVIIDYLQLMTSGKRAESRQVEVSEFSRSLKLLAKELGVPVIALSQLNRGPEQRTDKKPMVSDLRESGCLTQGTRVMRADTNEEITIGELFRSGARDIPVWALDERLKYVPRTMTHAFSSGQKEVFRIVLASGKQVEATANHPFLTYRGWAQLAELSEGSRIAVPRHIPPPIAITPMDEDQIVLLAHMIGDGSFVKREPIRYVSQDEECLTKVAESAAKRFGITAVRDEHEAARVVSLRLPAPYRLTHGKRNPIAASLEELGLFGLRSHEKFVPGPVFSLPKDQVALFLRHLWATDGCVFWDERRDVCRLYYATTSRRVAEDVSRLLLRFGIISRLKTVNKVGYRPGYQLHIYGGPNQLAFIDAVGVHGARSKIAEVAAEHLRSRQTNTNLDTIPAEVWEDVRTILAEHGMTHREVAGALGTQFGGSTLWKRAPSRQRLRRVADVLQDSDLELLATNDVFWDEIVSIESMGVQDVYDATVMGLHNFVADGISVKNSIEQDADMVILLHREDAYEKESPRAGEADLIVAKHRNGPTATVTVAFQGHYSRFVDMATG